MEKGRFCPRAPGVAAAAPRSPCPDLEVLAAYADEHLATAALRAKVHLHLSSCNDCRILLAHVLETLDAVEHCTADTSAAGAVLLAFPDLRADLD